MAALSSYILGLDIGSIDIKAVIAKSDTNGLSICGFGLAKTTGVKKGVITNIEQASNCIRKAVFDATNTAGRHYDKVIVSISGAYTKSVKSQGVITVPDNEISINEIRRAMEVAKDTANVPNNYVKLQILPYKFKVDEQDGIEDPLGMSGMRLEVSTHVIIVPENSIKNLTKAVEMAGINIDNIVLSGYASAIATLNEDEKELGVALIDMGGAVCDIVVHLGNSLMYNDILPFGSANITSDLSSGIHTSLDYAEKIKLNFDDLSVNGQSDINLPELGENGQTRNVSLEVITQILFSRIQEMLVEIYKKISTSSYENKIGAGIVLTGGMAKLPDVKELTREIFSGFSIRVAKPRNLEGLHEISQDLSNSCVIGLCLYGSGNFTPYEIDSNGDLKFKGDNKILFGNDVENELNGALNDSKSDENTKENSKLSLPDKQDRPNMVKRIWNYIKSLYC